MTRQMLIGILLGAGSTLLLELVGSLAAIAWHVHKHGMGPP